MRKIDRIVVHCAATPEGVHFDASDIDSWHRGRGWNGIGYHFVVLLDGTIEYGRPVETQGAHVRGYNKSSIGLCYIGGVDSSNHAKDTRTDAQKESLKLLIKTLGRLHPGVTISGHRDYSAKACPSFDATEEYKDLLKPKESNYGR